MLHPTPDVRVLSDLARGITSVFRSLFERPDGHGGVLKQLKNKTSQS